MKKIITILCLLQAASCFAQIPSFHELFKEITPQENGVGSPQGAAIFGKYLFQFHDRFSLIEVYDLYDKELVSVIRPEPNPRYHCNNACFSTQYYEKGDEFPLLYVSMEHAEEHCALVLRLFRTPAGDFDFEKVQTIVFPHPMATASYYTNIVLDCRDKSLYVGGYVRQSWNKSENGNAIQYLKYDLPSVEEKEFVLKAEDIRARLSFDFRVATQGAEIRNGKLYQVFGVPGMGPTSLCCFNLADGTPVWEFNLPECGINEEPEALDFLDDELLVVGVSGTVYASGMKVK